LNTTSEKCLAILEGPATAAGKIQHFKVMVSHLYYAMENDVMLLKKPANNNQKKPKKDGKKKPAKNSKVPMNILSEYSFARHVTQNQQSFQIACMLFTQIF
jgi:hypothetical protein